MKAITQDTYGSAEVLQVEDIDKPAMGPNDVLVRVHAAGIDRGVVHLMTGLPYLLRVMGFGLRAPKIRVPGTDVAGVVEATGGNVTSFKAGDAVFGSCKGAFAEYAIAAMDTLAPIPEALSFESAAAVHASALTALQALRDQGDVQAGDQVLVVGASGGVGTYAVQIAKALGAHVTGVASTSKIEMVRSLGAEQVLDYTKETLTGTGKRYDVILDIGGNRSLRQLRQALTAEGTLVVIGGENGGRWLGGAQRNVFALAMSPFVSQSLKAFVASPKAKDLATLAQLIDEGKIVPAVDRTFPFNAAAEAMRYVEAGHARGKVVIVVRPNKTPPRATQ